MIYFVGCGDLVKIGTTSSDVHARLSNLQTGNPAPMVLLGQMLGGTDVEAELHRRFRALHVRGEWFRHSDDLRAFIASLNDIAVPYGLLDADSAFFGLFDRTSGLVYRAYAQAHRAVPWSSVGQWWRFGRGWEEGTNPVGGDPTKNAGVSEKTVLCALRAASEFQCEAGGSALQRLLRKAKEFRPQTASSKRKRTANPEGEPEC